MNAPTALNRDRANQVNESRVPRPANAASANANRPYRSESSVASKLSPGTGPGASTMCPRPAGTSQLRQRSCSVVPRASIVRESSAPSNVTRTCAAPRSDRVAGFGAVSGPTIQVTSESSELRLSALKSSDTTARLGRSHPSAPDPVVTRPGCPMRSESTYTWPPAMWIAARPVSRAMPMTLERESVAVNAPTGGVALSRTSVPATVKLRREAGPPPSQLARSTS